MKKSISLGPVDTHSLYLFVLCVLRYYVFILNERPRQGATYSCEGMLIICAEILR